MADLPDAPDFKRTIDYVSWYRRQLPDVSSSRNAYTAYTKFMPNIEGSDLSDADWPSFFGMFTMPPGQRASAGMATNGADPWPPGPGPWRAKFHQGWNGGFERTKEVLKQYREAAKRKALVAPVKLSGDGKSGRLVSLRFPYTQYQHQCALGLLEGAWQVTDDGKVSIGRMRSAIDCNLRTAAQMRGCMSIDEQAEAVAIRLETYRNVRWAFALGILNEHNASKVAHLLRKIDGERVDCRPAVSGECAKWLDGLQYIFGAGGGGKGSFDGNRYREITGQSMGGTNRFGIGARLETDPIGSGNAIRSGYSAIRSKCAGEYSAEKATAIRQAFDQMANATQVNRGLLMGGSYPIVGLYNSAGKAEAQRRGTILLAELFAYKAKKGDWPKKLSDLGSDALSGVGDDSYNSKPFTYLRLGDEPYLYSVGPNGKDNGGASDDIVMWPIPDSKLWIKECALNAMGESDLTKLSDIKQGLKDKVVVVEAEVAGIANEVSEEHGRVHRLNLEGQGTSKELIYYEAVASELKPHQQPVKGTTYRIRVKVVDFDGAIKLMLENESNIAPAF